MKGFDEAAIGEALGRLEAEGLQSDRRFLEAYVRARFLKGFGARRIRQELQQRGIGGGEDLEEYLLECDFDESMKRVHGKKFGEAAPASPREYSARVRFLSQRGFEPDRIQALLRRLRRGDD